MKKETLVKLLQTIDSYQQDMMKEQDVAKRLEMSYVMSKLIRDGIKALLKLPF